MQSLDVTQAGSWVVVKVVVDMTALTAGEYADAKTRKVRRVLLAVLSMNLIVSVAKIIIGTATGTSSVRADGIHSIFDCMGNLAAIVGVQVSARPADADHPYGHGKYETIASLVIGLMLLVAAFEVGSGAIIALASGKAATQPSSLSLGVMIVTLVINLSLTAFESHMGKRLGSSILGADSKHTLSDALVTISVIVGLVVVNLGFPIADPIATLVVTAAIIVTSLEILGDVNRTFSDTARIDPALLRNTARDVHGVVQCHAIRTRGMESEIYVDMHVLVDADMSIGDAHKVAQQVEDKVKERFQQVRDVMVHLEPADVNELECPLLENGLAPDPYGRQNMPLTGASS